MSVIRIAFLDVGQGDTTVLTCPETQEAIVVDCVDSISVIDYLKRENIKQLRGIILTHLHADHYDQAANLLYNCTQVVGTQGCEVLVTTEAVVNPADLRTKSVRMKWPADGDRHSVVYEQPPVGGKKLPPSSLAKLYQWSKANEEKCKPIFSIPGFPLPIQGTLAKNLEVLHPPFVDYQKLRTSGLNNVSIVLRVTSNGSSALLMGDIEPDGWKHLKGRVSHLKSDVLKFPHHGGTWEKAETDDLIATVKPSTVVISVGSNNSFNHPHSDVFTSLSTQKDIRLLCTQATDKCQQSVQIGHEKVLQAFQTQSRKDNSFFINRSRKQCPCAGTVIIELGDKPLILQPDLKFHESIINIHFHEHKCRILNVEPINSVIVKAI